VAEVRSRPHPSRPCMGSCDFRAPVSDQSQPRRRKYHIGRTAERIISPIATR
jgi:hypothetical protein